MRITNVNNARKIAAMTLKHTNLPESYIRRVTEIVEYKAPKLPNFRQITKKKILKHYELDRPWMGGFIQNNMQPQKKVWVEPIKDWSFFKGDKVEVLTGKDKGKQGIVVYVVQERNWVLVQGLNTYLAKTSKKENSSLVSVEAPLLVNREVALVEPDDLKPTEIEWRFDEKGNKVRVSTRTGRIIPIPLMEESTYDYVTKKAYEDQSKDTSNEELTKVTFLPALSTFEMNIMDEMGIKEDRIPAKMYWY